MERIQNQAIEAVCTLCGGVLAELCEPLCPRCEKLHFEAMIEAGDAR